TTRTAAVTTDCGVRACPQARNGERPTPSDAPRAPTPSTGTLPSSARPPEPAPPGPHPAGRWAGGGNGPGPAAVPRDPPPPARPLGHLSKPQNERAARWAGRAEGGRTLARARRGAPAGRG